MNASRPLILLVTSMAVAGLMSYRVEPKVGFREKIKPLYESLLRIEAAVARGADHDEFKLLVEAADIELSRRGSQLRGDTRNEELSLGDLRNAMTTYREALKWWGQSLVDTEEAYRASLESLRKEAIESARRYLAGAKERLHP